MLTRKKWLPPVLTKLEQKGCVNLCDSNWIRFFALSSDSPHLFLSWNVTFSFSRRVRKIRCVFDVSPVRVSIKLDGFVNGEYITRMRNECVCCSYDVHVLTLEIGIDDQKL